MRILWRCSAQTRSWRDARRSRLWATVASADSFVKPKVAPGSSDARETRAPGSIRSTFRSDDARTADRPVERLLSLIVDLLARAVPSRRSGRKPMHHAVRAGDCPG